MDENEAGQLCLALRDNSKHHINVATFTGLAIYYAAMWLRGQGRLFGGRVPK